MKSKLLKEFYSLDMWVRVLLVVCVILILWGLFWPRQVTYVKLIPTRENMFRGDADVEHMENDEPTFAMFYAPWCGYCKRAMPEWDSLTEKYNKCKVMKVNCDENKELGKLHGVKSYPTIKFLPNGINNPSGALEFNGNRTASDFMSFLDQHVSADPSRMPNQASPLHGAEVPPYRAGEGPLTTSFASRNMNLS